MKLRGQGKKSTKAIGEMCILSAQCANSGMKSNKFRRNSSLSAYAGSPLKYIIQLSLHHRDKHKVGWGWGLWLGLVWVRKQHRLVSECERRKKSLVSFHSCLWRNAKSSEKLKVTSHSIARFCSRKEEPQLDSVIKWTLIPPSCCPHPLKKRCFKNKQQQQQKQYCKHSKIELKFYVFSILFHIYHWCVIQGLI